MITVWGEGRGFRVVWLLEEMGLPYRLRPVDLIRGAEHDPEFLGINPAGFIPALEDGDALLVESIAIMEYLLARYGPSGLAPDPHDPAFAPYQQFLHMGEAGLAMAMYVAMVGRDAPGVPNKGAAVGLEVFESRLGLVRRQLERAPYMAGAAFTAADISVTYALEFADRTYDYPLGAVERAYVARTSARPAYARAMDACADTKAWVEGLRARREAPPVG